MRTKVCSRGKDHLPCVALTNDVTRYQCHFSSLAMFVVMVHRFGTLYEHSWLLVFRKYKGCEIVGWASKKTYGYDGNKSGENKHFKWGENDESCMCVRDELLHRRNSSAGQESGSNWRAGLLQSRVISKRWGKVINKMENLAHELDDQNQHRCPLACVNSGGGPEFVWELKG